MDGSTKVVQPIWDEFNQNREKLISMSEEILASRENTTLESKYNDILFDLKDIKGVDKDRLVKTRINQSYFRRMILSNYVDKCAITGIDIHELYYSQVTLYLGHRMKKNVLIRKTEFVFQHFMTKLLIKA